MPTNQNAYNTRVTDESLEKRFRDTFTSQGGAELVNDLYASGVIVPIVDFTAAAEGSSLRTDLQVAWDFSTGSDNIRNTTKTLINTTGFWKVDLNCVQEDTGTGQTIGRVQISDGLGTKTIFEQSMPKTGADSRVATGSNEFVVFLRAGDSLTATSSDNDTFLNVWWRQIADVSGNLTNPLGFTSS